MKKWFPSQQRDRPHSASLALLNYFWIISLFVVSFFDALIFPSFMKQLNGFLWVIPFFYGIVFWSLDTPTAQIRYLYEWNLYNAMGSPLFAVPLIILLLFSLLSIVAGFMGMYSLKGRDNWRKLRSLSYKISWWASVLAVVGVLSLLLTVTAINPVFFFAFVFPFPTWTLCVGIVSVTLNSSRLLRDAMNTGLELETENENDNETVRRDDMNDFVHSESSSAEQTSGEALIEEAKNRENELELYFDLPLPLKWDSTFSDVCPPAFNKVIPSHTYRKIISQLNDASSAYSTLPEKLIPLYLEQSVAFLVIVAVLLLVYYVSKMFLALVALVIVSMMVHFFVYWWRRQSDALAWSESIDHVVDQLNETNTHATETTKKIPGRWYRVQHLPTTYISMFGVRSAGIESIVVLRLDDTLSAKLREKKGEEKTKTLADEDA